MMFNHLKLWVTVARHNFKWGKIYILVHLSSTDILVDNVRSPIYTVVLLIHKTPHIGIINMSIRRSLSVTENAPESK